MTIFVANAKKVKKVKKITEKSLVLSCETITKPFSDANRSSQRKVKRNF